MMMNGAELHLLLNHIPVISSMITTAILFFAMTLRSVTTQRSVQAVALWILIGSGLIGVPTYLTGTRAERVVKNYPGVERDRIHRHEEAALPAFILLETVALGAAALLYRQYRHLPVLQLTWVGLLILNIVLVVVMARVAHRGGEIRHEEIESLDEAQP